MFFWLTLAFANPEQAERLAALRAEVESERAALRRDRTDLEARLGSLQAARSDAELEVGRQRLALERLRRTLADERANLPIDKGTDDPLIPVLRDAVASLADVVKAGLPFRKTERLAVLDDLTHQLDAHPSNKVAAKLWQFVEDELALRNENALSRQVVTLDGEERLVQMARLGMVALYIQTDDGVTAYAKNGDWSVTEGREHDAIDALFTQLERRVRTGWVSLPGLPEKP